MTIFVVDANVVFELVNAPGAIDHLAADEACAPPLLWPEVRSVLHVARWRGLLSDEDSLQALEVLESGRIHERRHRELGTEAWRIADLLGWSKTYDAEYLALATLLEVPVATFDQRVAGAAQRLDLPLHVIV